MLDESKENRSLLNEAAYSLISQEAPEELPLYIETRDRYFNNPREFTERVRAKDEPLAFGSVEPVTMFTQVVFPLLSPILGFILLEATKAFKEEGAKKAQSWVRNLFNQPQPLFSTSELEAIQKSVLEISTQEAERLGLNADQVTAFQNALIARLALTRK